MVIVLTSKSSSELRRAVPNERPILSKYDQFGTNSLSLPLSLTFKKPLEIAIATLASSERRRLTILDP
jgi:hypothetical protein